MNPNLYILVWFRKLQPRCLHQWQLVDFASQESPRLECTQSTSLVAFSGALRIKWAFPTAGVSQVTPQTRAKQTDNFHLPVFAIGRPLSKGLRETLPTWGLKAIWPRGSWKASWKLLPKSKMKAGGKMWKDLGPRECSARGRLRSSATHRVWRPQYSVIMHYVPLAWHGLSLCLSPTTSLWGKYDILAITGVMLLHAATCR